MCVLFGGRIELMREVNPVFLPSHPIRVMPALLEGDVTVPASKSVAHRALICAALSGDSDWRGKIRGLDSAPSQDLQVTETILRQIVEFNSGLDKSARPDNGESVDRSHPGLNLDCGESGSTLRFMIPLLLACGVPVTLNGMGRLPRRPLKEYESIFAEQNVELIFPDNGDYLPLNLSGRLRGGRYEVPGHVSSQYLSGLLMALPLTNEDCQIVLTSKLQSRSYVNLTVDVMRSFGVEVEYDSTAGDYGTYYLNAGQRYHMPDDGFVVEGDYSQAAFWLAASFIGAPLKIYGLNPRSVQGDRAVLDILRQLGTIRTLQQGNLVVDCEDIPDLVPILALTAATVPGTHRFENCGRLRLKESDRLDATAEMLISLGAKCSVNAQDDSLLVFGMGNYDILEGNTARRATASAHGDHRMAMCLAIAGCCSRHGAVIDQPACVAKSYPDFFEQMVRLGGVFIEEKD